MGNPISGQSKDWAAGERLRVLALNRIGDSNAQNVGVFPGAFDYGGRFPGGTVRIPNAAGGSAAAAKTIFPPWYPVLSQDPGTGDYEIIFFPGTIAGVLPTNISSVFTLTASSVNYIWATCTASAGVVTSVTLNQGTSYPTLAASTTGSPPTSFNIPLVICDLTQSPPLAFNLPGFGNIWAQPYVTLYDTVNTGALLTAPFTTHYNWEWGAGD